MVSSGRGGAKRPGAAARDSIAVTLRSVLVISILVGALAGCVAGDDEPRDPAVETAEAGASGEAPEALNGPPVLGTVTWSTAVQPGTNEPVGVVERFPDSTSVLYAVFPVQRLPKGSSIRASWTFNGTSLDGLEQELTAPRDQVSGWLEFHLERTTQEPWPDGQYAVSLTADNVQIATAEVAVART
jgi:hypothetical protein